jgi:hypothetical protein
VFFGIIRIKISLPIIVTILYALGKMFIYFKAPKEFWGKPIFGRPNISSMGGRNTREGVGLFQYFDFLL